MARTVRRSGKGSDQVDVAPGDEREDATAPAAAAAAPPGAPPGDNGGGAHVDVRMRGPAQDVRKAAAAFSEQRPPVASSASTEEAADPEMDRIVKLLSDYRNAVIVTRVDPQIWYGQKVDIRCGSRWQCPLTIDRLSEDVFGRFGGKRFNCVIIPNTPNGELKALGGFSIENPEEEEPLKEGAAMRPPNALPPGIPGVPQLSVAPADPTLRDHDSPLALARAAIRRKIEMTRDKQELKESLQALKELDGAEGQGQRVPDQRDEELRLLRARLEQIERDKEKGQSEDKWERRLDKLTEIVTKSLERPKKEGDSDITQILLAQLQSSDTRFNTMMQSFTQSLQANAGGGRRGGSDEDAVLDKLSKYKSLFGSDDSKSKRLEDMAWEFLMERMAGGPGAPADEQDTVQYAIKQLTPVLKTYVEKKIEADGKPSNLTPEQYKKMVHEEASRQSRAIVEDLQKKGYIIKVGAPGLPGPKPQPPAAKAGAGQKAGAPPAPKSYPEEGTVTTVVIQPEDLTSGGAAPRPTTPTEETTTKEERPDMGKAVNLEGVGAVQIPASPMSRAYNRKAAVNFVLDSIRSEVHQRIPHDRPDDSLAAGDMLDRLDEELLDNLAKISTGADLEKLLADAGGDPEKIEHIKQLGRDDQLVKTWLNRVIATVQDEWLRSGGDEEPGE